MADRVTQVAVDVVILPSTTKGRVTQEAVEVVYSPSTTQGRVTQTAVDVIWVNSINFGPRGSSGNRSTAALVQINNTLIPPRGNGHSGGMARLNVTNPISARGGSKSSGAFAFHITWNLPSLGSAHSGGSVIVGTQPPTELGARAGSRSTALGIMPVPSVLIPRASVGSFNYPLRIDVPVVSTTHNAAAIGWAYSLTYAVLQAVLPTLVTPSGRSSSSGAVVVVQNIVNLVARAGSTSAGSRYMGLVEWRSSRTIKYAFTSQTDPILRVISYPDGPRVIPEDEDLVGVIGGP